jgi:hypothetical protein
MVAGFEGKANAIHGGKTRIPSAERRSLAIKKLTTSWPGKFARTWKSIA